MLALLFIILIWPSMLLFIIIAGAIDFILFILTLGLCFGKCKDPKRTWFSYTCVRGATLCASEIVTKICDGCRRCHCCCLCFPITLPFGFAFVIIGFSFDLIAWLATGFYCCGYCCRNGSILEFSLGRIAWNNLKHCLNRVKNCQ